MELTGKINQRPPQKEENTTKSPLLKSGVQNLKDFLLPVIYKPKVMTIPIKVKSLYKSFEKFFVCLFLDPHFHEFTYLNLAI